MSFYWASLIGSLLPGLLLFVVGQALFVRGRDPESMSRGQRLTFLGGIPVRVLPGIAIILLVTLGEMQAPALIFAAVLIGSALFRQWADQVN